MKAYPLLHIILSSSSHVIMTFQDTDFSFSSLPLVQNGTGKTVHAAVLQRGGGGVVICS